MKFLMSLLLLANLVQAQPKPQIYSLAESRAIWLWPNNEPSDAMVWSLAPEQSKLVWSGNPIIGGGHEGIIQFISGSVTVSPKGQITQGEFVLDMNSIKNTDIKSETEARDLEVHLKSDDFFSVSDYPRASFHLQKVIVEGGETSVKKAKITGLLSIKGITNSITLPATILQGKEGLQIKAEVIIDRTKWDILHQSKSVFKDLKDGIISDEIKIAVDLKFVGC